MEILAGLLALLAGAGGGAGFAVDRVARDAIADQLDSVEVLEVRIQASPNFRLVGGHVDRMILAGRGLVLEPFPRVDVLELETDPTSVDIWGDEIELRSPLSAALRIAITEADINTALQSPEVLEQFQDIEAELPLVGGREGPEVFDLENPAVDFLGNNRVLLSTTLVPEEESGDEPLDISFEAGLRVVEGQRVRLVRPQFELNGVEVPIEIIEAFTDGLNRSLNTANFEDQGIFLRLLDLEISPDTLSAIGFVRVDSLDSIIDD